MKGTNWTLPISSTLPSLLLPSPSGMTGSRTPGPINKKETVRTASPPLGVWPWVPLPSSEMTRPTPVQMLASGRQQKMTAPFYPLHSLHPWWSHWPVGSDLLFYLCRHIKAMLRREPVNGVAGENLHHCLLSTIFSMKQTLHKLLTEADNMAPVRISDSVCMLPNCSKSSQNQKTKETRKGNQGNKTKRRFTLGEMEDAKEQLLLQHNMVCCFRQLG